MTEEYSEEYGDGYYAEPGDSGTLSSTEEFISDEPEEESLFISEWNEQVPASKTEADAVSLCVWPHVDSIVTLKRLDVYQCSEPKAQQASTNPKESLKMRRSAKWFAHRSIFFLDRALTFTKELYVETGGGPIKRQRVRFTYRYCSVRSQCMIAQIILRTYEHVITNFCNVFCRLSTGLLINRIEGTPAPGFLKKFCMRTSALPMFLGRRSSISTTSTLRIDISYPAVPL